MLGRVDAQPGELERLLALGRRAIRARRASACTRAMNSAIPKGFAR
jgi:hypothetical protein